MFLTTDMFVLPFGEAAKRERIMINKTFWLRCVISMSMTGCVWAQTISLRDTPQGKIFGSDRMAVRLDAQTGWPGEVLCDGLVVVQAAETRQCFDLKQDRNWVSGNGAEIHSISVEQPAPDTLQSRMQMGDWSVDAFVQLFPEQRMLRRWFEITWQGVTNTTIHGFWLQSGTLSLSSGGGYFFPAAYPPNRTDTAELVANRRTSNGNSPYPLIAETGAGWSAIWVTDELPEYSDRGSCAVVESAVAIRVTQSFNMQGRMRKGVTQKVGDAWLWLQPNDAETALRRMPEWFQVVGQLPPADRPDWLKRVILYSFHPGGTTGSQCRDLGGFKPATELLTHIRDLGCNAIWLMPLEDKSIYWPRDYYKLQEGLGTPEDYKALTARAHDLGMRVWQDCVPHGGSNKYPRALEHPEWLVQNEDGSTLDYWCFDFNWPEWIDYMSNVVSFYTREYNLDGFRIDACGGSKIPNWNPDIPYARASHSQAQGGFAMQRALRKAVKAIRPDGANLAEVGASVHGVVSDSTYDFKLCYQVLHDLRKEPAAVFVPRLRRWLHEQQYSEVPDLVRMRHLESHDSLRSELWYGARPERALMALISWIHGIPMVYHEMEDGHMDYFRRIFHVRNHVAELNTGTADYLSVQAPEGIFAALRTGKLPAKDGPAWHDDYRWDTTPKGEDRASVVLINLQGIPVQGVVSVPSWALPEPLRDAAWARDLMTGEKINVQQGQMTVSLPPFGYTVLRLESRALPELASSAAENESAEQPRLSGSLQVKSSAGTLILDGKTGFPSAWKSGWFHRSPIGMDLVLPSAVAKEGSAVPARLASGDGFVEARYIFGDHILNMRYTAQDEGVRVNAQWEGSAPDKAALLFDMPGAARWFAAAAEGTFESPFRVRHPDCDGVVGSIYRLPQGTSTLWDSRLHPFGLNPASAAVGAVQNGRRLAFSFEAEQLPATVKILDRVGEDHGMKVLMEWKEDANGIIAGTNALTFMIRTLNSDEKCEENGTGDPRLRQAGGGWQFENAKIRVRLGRNGHLQGLWSREGESWKQVVKSGGVYTDRGFSADKRYAQENDVEAFSRIDREGSTLRLQFSGSLRGFYRFDKMSHPVDFYTAYTFDDGADFGFSCAVKPEFRPTAPSAFLSMRFQMDGTDRATYRDKSGLFTDDSFKKDRYAQTAKSENPQRLPSTIVLSHGDDREMQLGDIKWIGALPDNVFMYSADLHFAWMDGPVKKTESGMWRGFTCRIGCGEELRTAGDLPIPSASGERNQLLLDGDFETAAGSGLLRFPQGTAWPQEETDRDAWLLPDDAGQVVVDGDQCMRVTGDGRGYHMIRQSLPTDAFVPGTTWRLSARMKGQKIKKADEGWKTACLRWAVHAGEHVSYTTASLPWGDSDWQTVSVTVTIPEGLKDITAEAGMNGNQGSLWIDDMRIEKVEKPGS